MEQNMPVIAKRVWSLVRVMFYMLRKGISKGKLMADLNMMMKRGKIAGKALQNLMFHHHHAWSISTLNHRRTHDKNHLPFFPSPPPGEYEFSCSNSPAYPHSLFSFHKKHNNNNHSHFFSCAHAPQTDEQEMVSVNAAAVMKALEMLQSEAASPALPGFGKSPMVKQLRITDSPFPLHSVDEDSHVDEAAEEFIMKFYNDLRRQNKKASFDLSRR